ncbi:hypothetical protein [Brazilian marseillevirus]|uniref:hypothetical protein n=1 Tax=Brazilian marseillevirus TaxID=1813599 RepID=UPI0007850583|nr:hypothetical protein A3303_gp018 [Brazilian marseillevirus]AMQ10526.1 hypothetical protein [Brazilian marseillevirus]
MSLTSEFEYNGNEFSGVVFTYSDEVVKMVFDGSGPSLEKTKELLRKFVDDAKAGNYATVKFVRGSSISTESDDRVSFVVAKYEKTGSGYVDFSLPIDLCLPAFESLIQ